MGINDVIVYIVIGFFCIGALDRCLGNRWGLGTRFTDGFMAMGPLTLAMVGIISLAPVLAKVLAPVVAPVYGLVGADPASFANTLIALDMGGYSLAKEMSQSAEAELFSWVFLGTMMGPTLVFSIPVGLGIIEKDDHSFFAKGILLGLITVPIGCVVGGLVAGLNLLTIFQNLIFPILLSIFISIGLWKYTSKMVTGFTRFAKGIEILAIVGLAAISVETFTGYVVIPGMTPLVEGIEIVAMIAVFLAGAFPMVAFLSLTMKKFLGKVGGWMGVNEATTTGLIASLAHNIPMFTILKDMDARGKVISVAFAVSGGFVFGGHLGFVAGVNKEVVFAMVVGKLTAGITAVVLALMVTRKSESSVKEGME